MKRPQVSCIRSCIYKISSVHFRLLLSQNDEENNCGTKIFTQRAISSQVRQLVSHVSYLKFILH